MTAVTAMTSMTAAMTTEPALPTKPTGAEATGRNALSRAPDRSDPQRATARVRTARRGACQTSSSLCVGTAVGISENRISCFCTESEPQHNAPPRVTFRLCPRRCGMIG